MSKCGATAHKTVEKRDCIHARAYTETICLDKMHRVRTKSREYVREHIHALARLNTSFTYVKEQPRCVRLNMLHRLLVLMKIEEGKLSVHWNRGRRSSQVESSPEALLFCSVLLPESSVLQSDTMSATVLRSTRAAVPFLHGIKDRDYQRINYQ